MNVRVFVERGDKKVFATAVDWPGWSRSAKSREEALDRLVEYGPRYKDALGKAAEKLILPKSAGDMDVVASIGNKNADFGVPTAIMDFDREALTDKELASGIALLKAVWQAFEAAVKEASKGKPLTPGARGGGRTLAKITEHVHGADREAYIPAIGAKAPAASADRSAVEKAFIEALHAKVRGELPERGPRGGERWPARYAIRRSAWHALDHAWEIQDRS